MALSGELESDGLKAKTIKTTAAVSLEKTDEGFTITAVKLDVSAEVPGADLLVFERAANRAKSGCPISRLLNAEILLEAKLI